MIAGIAGSVPSVCRRVYRVVTAAAVATLLGVLHTGCGGTASPAQPSSMRSPDDQLFREGSISSVSSVRWECMTLNAFGRSTNCPVPSVRVGAARLQPAAAPSAPGNLAAAVTGTTVTLTWTAAAGAPTSYIVEAGSAPGGVDLAVFDTGNAGTALVVTNVPAGTYYVRIRGNNASGSGPASGEIIVLVTVAGPPCAPPAPSGLSAVVVGAMVTLTWGAPPAPCTATSYILEAGSAPGGTNVANFNTGTAAPSFTAATVGAGTYFVRIRATNGAGTSAPSNEITVTVGGGTPPTGCSYGLNPTAQSVSSSGGAFTVVLTASCAWSAASDQPWLTLTSASSGSTNAVIGYAVASNEAAAPRTARITISGPGGTAQLVVTQNGLGTVCAYTLQTTGRTVPASAASYSVLLSATCSWTASSSDSWLSITSAATGTGSATIVYAVTANPSTSSRTATITVTGSGGAVGLTVTQDGGVQAPQPPTAVLKVSPNPCPVSPTGSGTNLLSCTFDGSSSTPSGSITNYEIRLFSTSGTLIRSSSSSSVVNPTVSCNTGGFPGNGDTPPIDVYLIITSPQGSAVTSTPVIFRRNSAC